MKSIAKLNAIKERMQSSVNIREGNKDDRKIRVVVGMATCGIAAGRGRF